MELINRIKDTEYEIRNMDVDKLISTGFRRDKTKGENKYDLLLYRFPVFTDGRYATIEGEITIDVETHKVKTDVYLAGSTKVYYPFYHYQYGNYPILNVITDNILKKFKKYNIVPATN